MQGRDRKAAVAAYKEQKVAAGIYVVRCVPTGACWIGRAPNLSTIQNRLWFSLRQNTNPHRSMQEAWRTHGQDAFTFEIVEQVPDEDLAFARDSVLKDRLAHWAAELRAETI